MTPASPPSVGGGRSLRYLAVIDPSALPVLRVGPVAVGANHPAAALVGSQSLVAFSTWRYDAQPLVVQGAGAGVEVTASAVFAEVLRIARAQGGPEAPLGGEAPVEEDTGAESPRCAAGV